MDQDRSILFVNDDCQLCMTIRLRFGLIESEGFIVIDSDELWPKD